MFEKLKLIIITERRRYCAIHEQREAWCNRSYCKICNDYELVSQSRRPISNDISTVSEMKTEHLSTSIRPSVFWRQKKWIIIIAGDAFIFLCDLWPRRCCWAAVADTKSASKNIENGNNNHNKNTRSRHRRWCGQVNSRADAISVTKWMPRKARTEIYIWIEMNKIVNRSDTSSKSENIKEQRQNEKRMEEKKIRRRVNW